MRNQLGNESYVYLEGGLPDEDAEEVVVEAHLAKGPPDCDILLAAASQGNEGGGGGVGGAVQVHHCLELLLSPPTDRLADRWK